ncbi:hypothetical protein E2C01_099851 [Portunus trituberculatus]|uniref:Uncharacterized protein n=1 Tax=Portunus trituberculatus TaxID=210409 RepID=A0A5B7KFX3_PORTR|nr:hypothetical protein [Portunus trituberculatus]
MKRLEDSSAVLLHHQYAGPYPAHLCDAKTSYQHQLREHIGARLQRPPPLELMQLSYGSAALFI